MMAVHVDYHMSHIVRESAFGICEQQRRGSQAHPCRLVRVFAVCCLDTTCNTLLVSIGSFITEIKVFCNNHCTCTDRFGVNLVGNSEDSLSLDEAKMLMVSKKERRKKEWNIANCTYILMTSTCIVLIFFFLQQIIPFEYRPKTQTL